MSCSPAAWTCAVPDFFLGEGGWGLSVLQTVALLHVFECKLIENFFRGMGFGLQPQSWYMHAKATEVMHRFQTAVVYSVNEWLSQLNILLIRSEVSNVW